MTREFQFVYINNDGSRKQARSHVMRQYLREKRIQQSVRLETSLHSSGSSEFVPLRWHKRDQSQDSYSSDELQLELYGCRPFLPANATNPKQEGTRHQVRFLRPTKSTP